MLATKETTKINSTVAQFKQVIDKHLLRDKYNTKFIFDKLSNVNCGIAATDYLQLHHAKWIGCTALHFAIEELNLEAFNILLSHGADFTMKNSSGSTALHQLVENKPNLILEACTLDDPFVHCIVSAHVKYNSFENPVNSNGLSHFHIACAVNNIEVVKGFLQNGVPVDQTVKTESLHFVGLSPLHLAAMNCAFEVVEILLLHGASIQKQDAKGMTPVHMILKKRLEILNQRSIDERLFFSSDMLLRLFLEKESNNDMIVTDNWGLTHLHIACTLKNSKIVEYYLQKVVNINHVINQDSPFCPGYTALHFAAMCNSDRVKLLLKHGADISIKDAKGVTTIDICIERYKTEDIYAVISLNPIWKNIMLSDGKTRLSDLVFAMENPRRFNLFLKKISKNFSICDSPLWPGYTPMHLAVIFSKDLSVVSRDSEETNLQILRNLYKQNPRMVYSKDTHGRTPLHLAFYLNRKSVLGLLFGFFEIHHDLLDQVDENGLSYVHIASAKNKTYFLDRLLAKHKNVSAIYRGKTLLSPTIQSGSTALHFAVANTSIAAVVTLVDFGADVYAKDSNDMTPVHLLARKQNRKLANVLLSVPDLKDSIVRNLGLSHLHVACFCGAQNHVKSLLDNGADINAVVTIQPNPSLILKNEFPILGKYTDHSLLLLACDAGQYDIAQVLFDHGAKILVDSSREIELFYKTFETFAGTFPDFFAEILDRNNDLWTRILADTRITALHYACLAMDDEDIKRLLSKGVDTNKQIRSDSPIFRGYTPLHVLMHVSEEHDDDEVDRVIEILLKAGADVTLQNGNSETVIHMVFNDFGSGANYKRVNELLEAQRDFSVNPINVSGYSHFHIACSICNNSIVQKFLTHGNIDINRPVDFFSKNAAGYTALHFAAGNEANLYGAWEQLHTVDLLLKHGANVHAEDKYGDTPLHECARFGFLNVFERLVREGADANSRNTYGNTPLYYYIGSDNVSTQGIITLLRLGCRLNVFDAMNDAGYVGIIVDTFSYASLQEIVSAVTINFKREMEADSSGRTIIHNMVSTSRSSISATQYTTLIEQMSETDCDIDHHDCFGRSALHMAANFDNFKAISALLVAGADVNVTDFDGKTAFPCDLDSCEECKLGSTNTDDSDSEDSEDDEDDGLSNHLKTVKFLTFHVKKLQLCGIDVIKQNEDLADKALCKFTNESDWSEELLQELETVKTVKIESHALTLYDFLSEYRAVADYPTMSPIKREDINKFFSPSRMDSLRINFSELAEIFALQYRKVRARPQLVEMGKNALASLIGFRMPEICSHFILVLLTNSALKNLIASVNQGA